MANLVRNGITAKHLQVFRGGFKPVDQITRLQLENQGCCGNGVTFLEDRLPQRMRPENGLAHTFPTGNNEKRNFVGNTQVVQDIVSHLQDNGSGATVGVFAIPDLALLTHIGFSVTSLPAGLTLAIGFRNADFDEVMEGAIEHTVVASSAPGQVCDHTRTIATRTLAAGDKVEAAANAGNVVTTSKVIVLDPTKGGAIFGTCDELVVSITGTPTDIENAHAGQFNFTIGINYDTVIRAEV